MRYEPGHFEYPEFRALYFYEIQNDTMYGWWNPLYSNASHIELLRIKE